MVRTSRIARKVGTQLTEIRAAVPSVVGHRLTRMAAAGTAPSKADKRELALMSNEKVGAAFESWNAMASYALTLNSAATSSVMAFWMPWAFASKPLPTGQDALMRMASAGLRPYQRIVKANDRRLRKLK